MKKLPISFYNRTDVVHIAKELIGKIVVSNIDGITTSGRIVETEAYVAMIDKASHAFGGKRTSKNEHMYHGPGTSYVYICYGMHQMLNVVTNNIDIADAILIRALEPIDGIETMLSRSKKEKFDNTITKGPGNVGRALGINKTYSGISLNADTLYIASDDYHLADSEIASGPRIGVDSAGKDALLPYRFYIRGNKFVSRNNK